MKTKRRELFTTIHIEGGLLSQDLVQKISVLSSEVPGLGNETYHLAPNEKINEAISRSWTRLQGAWESYASALERLLEKDRATALTRERWLLILFQELGYGHLQPSKVTHFEGTDYPISHFWHKSPIHLLGSRIELDKRTPGVAGAARMSPHSMIQEFLNRSDDHLWAFLSNGFKLRVLRDNVSLTRQAYIEFDLKSMMEGEVYSDFAILWILCHQSRVEAERPELCWLEKWFDTAIEQGIRAMESLRVGVEQAIQILGAGFLEHKANQPLRELLRNGKLDQQEYYHELLRLIYRLIFLFVAEDRDLLQTPDLSSEVKARYQQHYSTARIRNMAVSLRGGRHGDLWENIKLVFRSLESDKGCPELGLSPLGSYLWSGNTLPHAMNCSLSNRNLLEAFRSLSVIENNGIRSTVNFRNLGSEELGSIYESLLELRPELNIDTAEFNLQVKPGHERKTSGSYYTPSELIRSLLDTALEPLLDKAARESDPEKAILSLKVCDPACGSGHFLVAAAHRIARRLATARSGETEPTPNMVRDSLREVVGHCLYGVDINPMAVELCKVALWMEAMVPGKPLSFLDHRIKCGNSLLGATPRLIKEGLPDTAFKPILGDDSNYTRKLKKLNKEQRLGFFTSIRSSEETEKLADLATEVDCMSDDTLASRQKKEQVYNRMLVSEVFQIEKLKADAYCAAFVWKKTNNAVVPITTEEVWNPELLLDDQHLETQKLADRYKFFHFHVAFPDVFDIPEEAANPDNELCGWSGGFDVVLGNPPWDHIEFKEKEWFDSRDEHISSARTGNIRKKRIQALKAANPTLFAEYEKEKRVIDAQAHYISKSGNYPLCGRGRVNSYSIFAELNRHLLRCDGRSGFIVPSGIATDDTTKYYFQDVVKTKSLVSLFSFENEEFIFPAIHHATRFCLLTVGSGLKEICSLARFTFFARQVDHLKDPSRRFNLAPEHIELLNPNTLTCPIFRFRKDAELTKAIYRRVPVLLREPSYEQPEENPWNISFKQGLFNMTSDSHLFRTKAELEDQGFELDGNIFSKGNETFLPLYEAKMIHHFDHRWGTYEGQTQAQANQGKLPELDEQMHADPFCFAMPRYWVSREDVEAKISGERSQRWLLGWRDFTGATVFRTTISTIWPRYAAGDTFLQMLPKTENELQATLVANLNSLILDYASRQKIGGLHLKYHYFKQLPILSANAWTETSLWFGSAQQKAEWFLNRILELTYTAWDVQPFANDCGCDGPPFRWDEERRFWIRAELDSAFFHLYLSADEHGDWKQARILDGCPYDEAEEEMAELKQHFPTPRDAVDYIMDTFPIVKRKDEDKYGEYRTKNAILSIYDGMQRAIQTGVPYQTRLDPPPADPRCCHPPKEEQE